MMDKLNSLPIETLFKLKKQFEEACANRRHELFKVGRQATFPTNKRPSGICRIMITKLGPKNVFGYEIDEHGTHLTRSTWRVGPGVLEPVFDKPKALIPVGGVKDRPASPLAGSF